MSTSSSRRAFLQKSCAAMAALPILGRRRGVSTEPTAAPARLLVGCRDALLKNCGAVDCWQGARAAGVECLELTVGDDLSLAYFPHPTKKYSLDGSANIAQLAADAKAAGIRLTAILLSNKFDQRPDFEVEWLTKTARAAQALGIKAIRIDVVSRKKSEPDEFLKLSVDVLKRVMKAIEPTGVSLGVENHGRTTNDPDFLGKLFAGVGSPRLGLTLDTGNFYWFGHPLAKIYQLYETFAPRVVHTHCKSIRYPADQRDQQRKMGWEYAKYNCPVYEGDIDFRRVVSILKKAGYANDLCIEDESLGKYPEAERAKVLAREVQYLKGVA